MRGKAQPQQFKREAHLERKACGLMQAAGLDPRKQNVINHRGRFDRLVLGNHKYIVFVEFKLPGFDLSPLQRIEQEKLLSKGFSAVVVKSLEDTKSLVIEPYKAHLEEIKNGQSS